MSSSAIYLSNPTASVGGQSRNVYVASLPLHFDDQQLHNLFSPYGRIISARIMRAKKSHLSKGYGFVMFREMSSAEQAIQALHGRVIGGSRIQVRWASADASSTFSKVSHNSTASNVSSTTTAPATSSATTAAVQNPQLVAPTTNLYPAQMSPSQPYTILAPTMAYEQLPQQPQSATAVSLNQSYGALVNSPGVPAQGALSHPSYAPPYLSPAMAAPVSAAPLSPQQQPQQQQQPVYVMVLPNGERHMVQLNQFAFQNM